MAKSSQTRKSLLKTTDATQGRENHCFVTDSRRFRREQKPSKTIRPTQSKRKGGGALASIFSFVSLLHISNMQKISEGVSELNIVKTFKSKCQKINHKFLKTFQTTKKLKWSLSFHLAEIQTKCKNVFRKMHIRKIACISATTEFTVTTKTKFYKDVLFVNV